MDFRIRFNNVESRIFLQNEKNMFYIRMGKKILASILRSQGHRVFTRKSSYFVTKKYSRCWGVAYNIDQRCENKVLESLDLREKNGYERIAIIATSLLGRSFDCLTYVAGPNNPYYSEEASLERVARQINRARGPSGTNAEYITSMIRELRRLGVYDQHVESIFKRLGGGAID